MEFINTIINGFHYLSQTWGQDFDIVVTVATLIVSFIAWIKTKTLVKKLTYVPPKGKINKDPRPQVALVMDLSSRNAFAVAEQVKACIAKDEHLAALRPVLLDAEALVDATKVPAQCDGNFDIGYSYTDEACKYGRFVVFQYTGERVPADNADALTRFHQFFGKALAEVVDKLASRGITTIHLFYKGPVSMAFVLGEKFANNMTIQLYQYMDVKDETGKVIDRTYYKN